jgi:prepilin-type N-terminal cleavage/methylation domain-containing protein
MKRFLGHVKKSQSGFTLVELLWVSLLMVMVLAAGYFIYETAVRTYNVSSDWSEAQQSARGAERLITRYLRQATGLNAAAVTDYSLGFYANISSTSTAQYVLIQNTGTDVDLTIDGLNRGSFHYVRNLESTRPMFTYLNRDSDEITSTAKRASDTRSVRVTLVTDADTGRNPPAYELTTLVKLRNIIW